MVALNDGFVLPITTMIKSLVINGSPDQINYKVFALYSDLSIENQTIIRDVFCNDDISFEFVDCKSRLSLLDVFTVSDGYWSMETYYRLLSVEVLPQEIDRILYLDGDIIINGPIDDFYFQDFDNMGIVACEDVFVSHKNKQVYENLDLDFSYNYFNAGVILFNLEWIRNTPDYMKNLQEIGNKYRGKLLLNDQDILNVVYRDSVKWEDENKYNMFVTSLFSQNDIKRALAESRIIHYCGKTKPWHSNYRYCLEDVFWHYCIQTSFENEYISWKKNRRYYQWIPFLFFRLCKRNIMIGIRKRRPIDLLQSF